MTVSGAAELRAERRAKNARVVAAAALDLGTREAARRFGLSKNTVTDYLRLSNGIEPMRLQLQIHRDGPRGFRARAFGRVRQVRGKVRRGVRFSVEVRGLQLRQVLEQVIHKALALARAKAGLL